MREGGRGERGRRGVREGGREGGEAYSYQSQCMLHPTRSGSAPAVIEGGLHLA